MERIFVSIASYRDPELKKTLEDLISNCEKPELLDIAIAWQHSEEDEWDNLDEYQNDPRFNIIDIDYSTSKGVCWARNLIHALYTDQKYYLQLDSHHRFEKNWDRTLKDYLHYLQCIGYQKPILSAYLPSYNPKTEEKLKEVWGLNIDRFLPEGPPFLRPYNINNWNELVAPFKARFLSGHFIFTLGSFVKDVPYDPNIYFHGEETSLAVRAYTHGYDLFSPHRPVIYHEYTRSGKQKHWDDSKEWGDLDLKSYERFRKLFGMDPGCTPCQRKSLAPYTFGEVRSLVEYERYSGLKFETRQIHKDTKNNIAPPIITDYESGLLSIQKYCIDIHKPALPEKDYEYFVVSFLDKHGNDIYRQDTTPSELSSLFSSKDDQFIHIWREYEYTELAHSWRVWPYSKSKGFCDRIEQEIRYE